MRSRHFILLLLSLIAASCANTPRIQLPSGAAAFPKCHSSPPTHVWTSFDGTTLPYLRAMPSSSHVKAVVMHITGVDGVTGDLATLTRSLTQAGYAVYGSENRSFAYGPAALRGDAHEWRPWIEDIRGFMRLVRREQPGRRIFWHAHSFGAVQALYAADTFTAADMPDGLIIHSPGLALMPQEKKRLRGLTAASLGWMRIPQLRFIDAEKAPISSDPLFDARWAHSEDRVRDGIKVRFFIQATKLGQLARQAAPRLKMPVLALWGGADVVALGGKKTLHYEYEHFMRQELAAGHATPFYRADGRHLLTEGHTRDDALQAIRRWLAAHTSPS